MLVQAIDVAANELINCAILGEIAPATPEESGRARRAIKKYNVYVENLKRDPVSPDIPLGIQEFIGKVQTSGLRRPTEQMAFAVALDKERRARYEALVHAVDKGIEVASYMYKGPSRECFELDIRKKFSFEVGKPKALPTTLKKYMPFVYKAICVCLDTGGVAV